MYPMTKSLLMILVNIFGLGKFGLLMVYLTKSDRKIISFKVPSYLHTCPKAHERFALPANILCIVPCVIPVNTMPRITVYTIFSIQVLIFYQIVPCIVCPNSAVQVRFFSSHL